jgi:hypothetical protein
MITAAKFAVTGDPVAALPVASVPVKVTVLVAGPNMLAGKGSVPFKGVEAPPAKPAPLAGDGLAGMPAVVAELQPKGLPVTGSPVLVTAPVKAKLVPPRPVVGPLMPRLAAIPAAVVPPVTTAPENVKLIALMPPLPLYITLVELAP